MKKILNKNFIWNMLGSGIYSFNSLFYLIIVTRINGLDISGIFAYGFVLSNVFLLLATFGGRTYQITDKNKEFSTNEYISFRIICSIITVLIALIFVLINPYNKLKGTIIFLLIISKCFESISDVFYGIMQKKDKLYLVGISMFIKNVISIVLFYVIDYYTHNIYLSILSYLLIYFVFIFIDIMIAKKEEKFHISIKNYNKKIISKQKYLFLFTIISSFILHIPRYVIDYSLSDDIQGIYSILIMPSSIVILLTSFVLQPNIVRLTSYFKENHEKFKKLTIKIVIVTVIISVLCLIGFYFLGIELLSFIYDTPLSYSKYNIPLLFGLIGTICYTLVSILSVNITIARDTLSQLKIYALTTVISIIIAIILTKYLELFGSLLSYMLSNIILLLLYLVIYRKKKI